MKNYMKTIKFRHSLVENILNQEKTTTWRLFDDKDLQVGDDIELIDWESREMFSKGRIVNVYEKKISEIEDSDYKGHKKYGNLQEMINGFREFYGDRVNKSTIVKIIEFKIYA